MCLIVLCCLSLCYMCIHLFDCYSVYIFLYMFFANKEFIHSFNKIQSKKYPTVRTVPQTNRKIVQAESKLITLTHKSPIALLPCYMHFNKTLKTESNFDKPPWNFLLIFSNLF